MPLKQATQSVVEDFQRRYCIALLERCGGNRSAMARHAESTRHALRELLVRLGLD